MDLVAVIAAGAAVAAAIWTAKNARHAERSAGAAEQAATAADRAATAAERSATAGERSADAAQAQLRVDEERAERERRAHEDAVAPVIAPTGDYAQGFALHGDQIVGLVINEGKTSATVDSATLAHPRGTATGQLDGSTLPHVLGPNVVAAASFHLGVDNLEALTQGAARLTVEFVFRVESSPYRGRASFQLRRDTADVQGDLRWKADRPTVQRLD